MLVSEITPGFPVDLTGTILKQDLGSELRKSQRCGSLGQEVICGIRTQHSAQDKGCPTLRPEGHHGKSEDR